MKPSQLIETYRFWDIVSLWARERLEHEVLVAQALVAGIIRDGLRFESQDLKRMGGQTELRGDPFVGYCPDPAGEPVVLSAATLEHLLSVFRTGKEPSRDLLHEIYISKAQFRSWLEATGQPLPGFWYADKERQQG